MSGARTGRENDANFVERSGRAISDAYDKHIGAGVTRDLIHATWHAGAGVVQGVCFNGEAAKAEFSRAGVHMQNAGEKMPDEKDARPNAQAIFVRIQNKYPLTFPYLTLFLFIRHN